MLGIIITNNLRSAFLAMSASTLASIMIISFIQSQTTENMIGKVVSFVMAFGMFALHFGQIVYCYSGYSVSELRQLLKETEDNLWESRDILESIKFPVQGNSYNSVQNWAIKYIETKSNIFHYDGLIMELENELMDRPPEKPTPSIITFDVSGDTLYLYKGYPSCHSLGHTIISVTAEIPNIYDKIAKLDVSYCENCELFFIKYSNYEYFLRMYKYLIASFEIVEIASSNKQSKRNLAENSPLKWVKI